MIERCYKNKKVFKIPDGWRKVKTGKIRVNDKYANKFTGKFDWVPDGVIGLLASSFYFVIRMDD